MSTWLLIARSRSSKPELNLPAPPICTGAVSWRQAVVDRNDAAEAVVAVGIGPDRTAKIERRLRCIEVRVITEIIGVPDFHQRIAERLAVFASHASTHQQRNGRLAVFEPRVGDRFRAPAAYKGPSIMRMPRSLRIRSRFGSRRRGLRLTAAHRAVRLALRTKLFQSSISQSDYAETVGAVSASLHRDR
jgi:hypothetical protein